MRLFVTRQVSKLHRPSERDGLTEREAQAFAGDCVHAAGSIADKRNIVRVDGAKRMHLRDCPPLAADNFRASQPIRQLRTVLQ